LVTVALDVKPSGTRSTARPSYGTTYQNPQEGHRMSRRLSLAVTAALLAMLSSGCFGTSASPTSTPSRRNAPAWVRPANLPGGVDRGTVKRLMAEWHAARYSCTGEPAGCPYQPGVFASGSVLLPAMRRIDPSIPATNNLNATLSLTPFIFVLDDSTPRRLDIATADANGRYVHLVAVGTAQPRLRVAALGPLTS
jgi:hypothetical protein